MVLSLEKLLGFLHKQQLTVMLVLTQPPQACKTQVAEAVLTLHFCVYLLLPSFLLSVLEWGREEYDLGTGDGLLLG